MITKGDEYPIHQTPEPIAYSGTNRNFYDRFFFNGYSKTKDIFFSLALGIYPNINIKDAAFCLILDGVQHNLRASTVLQMERMDIQVGPISVEILEPLKKISIQVEDNEHGISASLTFTYNSTIVEEPRFTNRVGPRTIMDVTRMTQNGTWDGWIVIKGEKIVVHNQDFCGTRDRSWGVRAIGAKDHQPLVPKREFQFFWLWAPLNFENQATMFGLNERADGTRWHQNAIQIPYEEGAPPVRFKEVDVYYNFRSGTRYQDGLKLIYSDPKHGELTIEMTTRFHHYMSGLGYNHPKWGHGKYHGENALDYDIIILNEVDPEHWLNFHIQAIVDAKLIYQDKIEKGTGVLEQMIFGRHLPSGLNHRKEMFSKELVHNRVRNKLTIER